jgi:hypothetical protein
MAEPATIRKGAAVSWERVLGDYAGATSMTYTLSASGGDISFAGSGSGTTWTFSRTGAQTGAWSTSGLHAWKLEAVVSGETYLVDEGTIEIIDATATSNDLIAAKTNLAAAETELAARVSGKPSELTIGTNEVNRSLKRMTVAELHTAITYWKRQVYRETQKDRRRRGQKTGNVLKGKFSRAT